MSNPLPLNSCLLINNWEYYSCFSNLPFEVSDYQRIEIIRQILGHFDFGNNGIKNALPNPINYGLLSNNFTEQEKQLLNSVTSDVMIRLYMKCCELNMFDTHKESGNSYFPYYPEHIAAGTIVFMKSDPYT